MDQSATTLAVGNGNMVGIGISSAACGSAAGSPV